MVADKTGTSSNNPLEQFVLLAKSAKGAACLELIKQVLEAPGVHVFGELLDMPNVMELQNGPHSAYYNTLNLFAYGTYRQYTENRDKLLELSPAQKKKLQHLTIVTLATRTKCIPYATLLAELELSNVRDLEDLIIEAIYADIIQGKLDQKRAQLEVDVAIGRDVRAGELGGVVDTLAEWCAACEAVLECVEQQVGRANAQRNRSVRHRDALDAEVQAIRRTLKQPGPADAAASDEQPGSASEHAGGREAQPHDKGKKPVKPKPSVTSRAPPSVKLQR